MALDKYPFDPTSNKVPDYVYPHATSYSKPSDIEWRDNVPFEATLKVETYSRGRSSVTVILKNVDTGTEYSMFISETLNTMLNRPIVDAKVSGMWHFIKRGQSYSIAPVIKKD
ncbi:hypothetical protein PXH69_24475 [Rhodococcus qingshengii]|uniref:Uncharacterized protein n=1 Tax=Rhodococcus qingshengii TaxID=334542 RepID=A0AAW6LS91_RHOSG|nr:hypothetical protein [Rhodococcus qingshengii]MDE8648127.1 hypothetical protein [Rhodococcus qingshengii]